jgi:preprotein translocase subunit SecE
MIALAFAGGILALVAFMVGLAWLMDHLMRNGSE